MSVTVRIEMPPVTHSMTEFPAFIVSGKIMAVLSEFTFAEMTAAP